MIKLLLLTLLALAAVAAWAWSSHHRAKKQLAQEKENARLAAEIKAQEDARLKAEVEAKRLTSIRQWLTATSIPCLLLSSMTMFPAAQDWSRD